MTWGKTNGNIFFRTRSEDVDTKNDELETIKDDEIFDGGKRTRNQDLFSSFSDNEVNLDTRETKHALICFLFICWLPLSS